MATTTRIDANVLIPGSGDPVLDATLVLDGGSISYAGPAAAAPPASAGEEAHRVPVVMPGMWECHGHFMGITGRGPGVLEELFTTPEPVAAARSVRDAERALLAGFTSVREAGGLGVHLARVVDEGTVAGPTIYAPGAILSASGGHADIHGVPYHCMVDLCANHTGLQLCDGVADCLKAVRLQLRKGARVIKVCTSGGVMSEVDHPIHQQFSDDELRAIVEEAGRAERAVMAHTHGRPGIEAALRAGVRTIEHGTYLDEETAAMMVEADALLVPTRFIVHRYLTRLDALPEYAAVKMQMVGDRHLEAVAIAHQAGVKIALGTDIYSSDPSTAAPWGMNGHELGLLVDIGLKPLEAIEAATANAPLTLGPQAPRSGRLEVGYDADVIAVAQNPVDDVAVLAEPANVTHVWKGGVLAKQP